jgi:hypothetical protein
LESISPKLHEYLEKQFLPQRIKLGIKAKVISHAGEKNKIYKSMDKKTLRETRMVKDSVFVLHHEIDIYGENKVAIVMFNHEEMSALIIHSKKFHDTLLSIFNFIRKSK